MAMRSSWKGTLKLSLVSIPVQAFNASPSGDGDIHFHQLHRPCHSRIRYQKVCPIHGEVSNDDIVLGYEYAKGEYAIVDAAELRSLRGENERAITLSEFIVPEQLDARHLDGRHYYLVPDAPAGPKPYAVLAQAMQERGRVGLASVVFSEKDQLVLIRPVDGVLMMSMLRYAGQVRDPSEVYDAQQSPKFTAKELKLAEMLIDASTSKKFDIASYADEYQRHLAALIEAKVEGKELVAAPAQKEVHVINLMDALKQSLGQKQATASARRQAPAKKMAGSKRASETRRRKSS